jgi:benzoyl-CoA reductase/2-hydroxyglutaryl-CoA dehydratase subunit BcrC/BadD/HgdB
MDSFSYPYHDYINEEDPFLGLAEKILAYPYINMEKSHNKYLLELARKFRVDGVIQLLPMGCRACHGLARIKQDSFRDLGIPMLLLDVDTLDSRQYSDSQARTRIEAFVESIINRKQL